MRRGKVATLVVLLAQWCAGAEAEPTYEQAVARWPDMRRPIAFLGLKDHPDEFAVMWNGNPSWRSVMRTDADRRLFRDRRDESLQVTFAIGDKPDFEGRETEDGTTTPGLAEGYLPLTEIELRRGGVVLTQEAFVAGETSSCAAPQWDAPAFLRVRFTVREPGAGNAPIRLWAHLAPNHTTYAMSTRRNVRIQPVAPLYPRELRLEHRMVVDDRGLAIMAADQEFRFHARLPDELNSTASREWQMDRNVAEFTLPPRTGGSVELTFPFRPLAPERLRTASRSGFAEARQAVTECWKREIARGMQVEVPEEPLNRLWRFSVPLAFITADRYPNGDLVLKTSPQQYEAYWPTPNAMHLVELAIRGYREEVAAFLEPFLDSERRQPVSNTGASFTSSRGFISGPAEHLAISWVSDHGAILWAASEYFLLTRDQKFLDRWLPAMLEGLEWIASQRAATRLRGGPAAGLLPVGRATDADMQGHFVWSDAWVYRGLASVCRVLEAIGHPQAARWREERDDYRAAFQKALRRQIERTVRWVDRSGSQIPFVPYELRQTNADNLHAFYLDTGPTVLGVAGLVDPTDETMTWALKWLTEGPDAGRANPDWSDFSERPSLRFEMSSAEPCYSWNVYLRYLRNERLRFLEGFYSLAAGSVSRKFLGGVETRDGIQGVPVMNAVINHHLRNMLVFESEDGRGLDLLRNAPSSWLRAGRRIRVERAETYFGPLSLEVHSPEALRVEARIETPSQRRPERIRLHLFHPEGRALASATVNGKPVDPAAANLIEIQNPSGTLNVTARFRAE